MVKEWKKERVKEISEKIKDYKVLGIVDFHALPAKQLQIMKKKLKEKGVTLLMARKRILKRVLETSDKKNIKELIKNLGSMPALILSSLDPFRLAKIINDNKSPALAKAGQTSPKDIVAPAGPTPFTPGPIIGELGILGIKTKVEAGKLTITQDVIVVKKEEIISKVAASILRRLGIEPMEIGLTIKAVWEKGIIFSADQLRIDTKEYTEKLKLAHATALALSLNANIPIKETINALLQKLHSQAIALSMNTGFPTKQTRDEILRKAEGQAMQLARGVQEKDRNALSEQLNEIIVRSILGG
ncbi:MAG: 50S ribosomal protein L10 [Nanoarchaeota archaeon]|nr:50S ribosomal protein L10 [Nanoarchaeota archaeon]